VNITSGPVLVDVEGVECQVRVKDINTRTNHDRKRKQRTSASKSRSRKDSATDDDDAEAVIPTAADLAESFLQAEPDDERAELEAALLLETQDAGASSILSEDGEIPMGTGTALSVPDWVARLIQGVVDRLEVRIRQISVRLDMDIPSETSPSSTNSGTDPVTVHLKIDSVDIEGVTHDLETMTAVGDGHPKELLKKGKRLICLKKIRGVLISEANLFSSLARSSALSSPAVSHSEVFESRKASSRSHSSADSRSVDGLSSPEFSSTISSSRLSSKRSQKHSNTDRSLHESTITTDSGRFEDAPEDEERMFSRSINADSDIGDSVFESSAYLDQVSESQFDDEGSERSASPISQFQMSKHLQDLNPSPLSTPRASAHVSSHPANEITDMSSLDSSPEREIPQMLRSTILPTRPRPRFSEERVSRSQSAIADYVAPVLVDAHESPTAGGVDNISENDSEIESEEESTTPVGATDLAQSQLFSHEDAESMYMSAMSQGSDSQKVPGGWSDSSSGSDAPFVETVDSQRSEMWQKSPDNLDHARSLLLSQPSAEDEELAPSLLSASQAHPQKHNTIISSESPTNTCQPHSGLQASSNVSEHSTSSEDYTRISKHIFDIDQIALYLPGTNSEAVIEPPLNSTILRSTFNGAASESLHINLPGTFSTHLPTRHRPSGSRPDPLAEDKTPVVPVGTDNAIEVAIGKLLGHFDISVGRLAWKLIQRLKEVVQQDTTHQKASVEKSQPAADFQLTADQLSLQFLGRLEGVQVSSTSTEPVPWINPPEQDVLLRTILGGLSVSTHAHNSTSETHIQLQKFMFGYARENILSFDADLQMRASTRDLEASAGIDASIKISKSATTTRFDVNTLPMHVSIDLQRLDETFSWFGGLSSVLNLGSSIASNATMTTAIASRPKPRSVRFETTESPPPPLPTAKAKSDVRIGGLILDLVGAECSIGIETSAVKIISRDIVVGVGIQKISLSGPHLRRSNNDPAITVDVIGTRVEFLQSPQDVDLDTLLSLITPSKAKYDQDDDILLDTLLRQRKQGSVLRLTVDELQTRVGRLHELSYLPELGEEVARLSTVAKYLPDDDRPGLLSLIKIKKFDTRVDLDRNVGIMKLAAKNIEVAQITFPSLVALSINTVTLHRNGSEELIGAATDPGLHDPRARSPAIMARMIGDEMEPIVKIKIWNLKAEYRVPTLIALLNLKDNATGQDISEGLLAASIATLTEVPRLTDPTQSPIIPSGSSAKPMTIDIVIRDCILGLNPLGLPSKVLMVMTEAHLSAVLPKNKRASANGELGKASLLVIDNVANITSSTPLTKSRRESFDGGNSQVADLCSKGFVSISYISSARAIIQVVTDDDGEKSIDIELRDDLFVLESCADSTQTLVAVLNGLSPPTTPSKEVKYRTKVIPVADLLASLSGDAFGTAEGTYNIDDDFTMPEMGDIAEDSEAFDLDFQHYQADDYDEDDLDRDDESLSSSRLTTQDTHDGVLLGSFADPQEIAEETEELEFQEDHFGTGSILEGTAHRWNSAKNTYDKSNVSKVRKSPLKICVRDVHIIWNLFDGYDWQNTRDTIAKAVQDVESKAIERRARNDRRPTFEQDLEDDETVIGDFLFNSIYIGIPGNRDPRELAAAINQELNDNATETESIATTSLSASPNRQGGSRRSSAKRLRLKRSKHHKITFELRGVCVDLVAFPPGSGETQSSVDIRVRDFEIFDHVPTSTWRKFATYMQEAGERETGTSMIHIEILNVKPIPELAASEIVLKATVLPLRLHVDQDALDFITRFFEFKDESALVAKSPGDIPFLQRVEVNSIQVKLDFKPKRVDYAGLRSGHTTEFMNFLILDEADMVLRHTIIYGISGFDKLGKTLNDIWMPEIKRNQLPGILAGLAAVRPLVNVGGGFRHLVVVPMREYQKDGRIVRSISKGAAAFAKTTGTELVKLGAKVAIGVQTVLQGAEGLLSPAGEPTLAGLADEDEEEEQKHISPYAHQPVGVLQGLRGGYAGLQRDLVLARDAIIAVPGEVMEGGNAAGVLRAVRKHAPTVILRPAIGVAKAGGQILMGATNSMDPANLQRADAVSFSDPTYIFAFS